LTEVEFALKTGPGQVAEVDVDEKGKIGYHFVEELERQLALIDMRGPQTEEELAVWLDRAIEHYDITQDEASRFLRRMIGSLIQDREFTLQRLVANRFRLRDAAREKIQAHRTTAERQAYQKMLLPDAAMPLEVGPEVCFTFPLDAYPAVTWYTGPQQFNKHYYQNIAEMNGEEAACAALIDSLPEVEYWVRNLVRDGYSFWLQTATDKFYPDFVARLKDGRYLAVEYKGKAWEDTSDTEEKEAIGRLWEARSNGACIFRLVTKADMETKLSQAFAP
jgi:type III restriction enzyme